VVTALVAVAAPAPAQRALRIPPPRGYVNDFASVISPGQAARIDSLARIVRERSGGELAIVTLRDIGGRDVAAVALQIGREWRVGARADIGDARRNAAVVVLVVPKETSTDGRGYVSIQTGQGAEGFIPDGVAGDIRREGTEYFRRRDYGTGILVITRRLAERFAAEFRFGLDSAPSAPRRAPQPASQPARRTVPRGVSPTVALVSVVLAVIVLAGGARGGCATGGVLAPRGRRRRGYANRYGGFGSGSWGDVTSGSGITMAVLDTLLDSSGSGGGSDFGGFGGGGGFSGGGSSGSW
jgi:uncharacterized protein